MSSDSTVTSPEGLRVTAGVHRLVVLHAPPGAALGASKVIERGLLLTRSAEPRPTPPDLEAFVLDDPELSRRHARLEPSADAAGFELRDEGSHNGTFVNGLRVERARVSRGDVLRVGGHVLLLQFLDAAAGRRLARRRLEGSAILGEGPGIQWVDEQILAVAGSAAPTLILGESGTGKELVARELHAQSGRRGRFVAVNCTAVADGVADSELFGHVQGAFSGASRARDGLFVEAEGGTLLLDEIGDMPLPIQAKLLRVLETGEVRKVGSDRAQRVDTRVVAATHVDLEAAVAAGRFRGDLWARLQRAVIRVPPLRERREDVLVLARAFLNDADCRLAWTADAAEALLVHDWPFNVRELRNVLEAARRSDLSGRSLGLAQLPSALTARFAPRLAEPVSVPVGRDPTASELERILRQHGGNVTRVAALFGRDRKQIYRWCKALGVDAPRRR